MDAEVSITSSVVPVGWRILPSESVIYRFDIEAPQGAFFIGQVSYVKRIHGMQRASTQVVNVIEPVVTGLGYELVGAEFGQAENGTTLRVYIDKPEGIVMEDCAAVSRQLNAVLDVDPPTTTCSTGPA